MNELVNDARISIWPVYGYTKYMSSQKSRVAHINLDEPRRPPLYIYMNTIEEAEDHIRKLERGGKYVTGNIPDADWTNMRLGVIEKWSDEVQDWIYPI